MQAALEPETLRISLDTKAKVKIGEFSRGGVRAVAKRFEPRTTTCTPTPCLHRPASWRSTRAS